jgi:hypothetical protein
LKPYKYPLEYQGKGEDWRERGEEKIDKESLKCEGLRA